MLRVMLTRANLCGLQKWQYIYVRGLEPRSDIRQRSHLTNLPTSRRWCVQHVGPINLTKYRVSKPLFFSPNPGKDGFLIIGFLIIGFLIIGLLIIGFLIIGFLIIEDSDLCGNVLHML